MCRFVAARIVSFGGCSPSPGWSLESFSGSACSFRTWLTWCANILLSARAFRVQSTTEHSTAHCRARSTVDSTVDRAVVYSSANRQAVRCSMMCRLHNIQYSSRSIVVALESLLRFFVLLVVCFVP